MKKIIAILSPFIFCLPFIIWAHPGHGEDGGYTITHYFAEPEHLGITAVLLMGIILYIRHRARNKQTKQDY